MREAVGRLVRAGIPVLSQSVLLRGVNDDAAVLEALFRGLVAMRVKPYYLHHPDLAPGTGHFRLGIDEGQRLVGALRGRVSGLCQPTYVLDIPGGQGKVPVGPCAAAAGGVRADGWSRTPTARYMNTHRVRDRVADRGPRSCGTTKGQSSLGCVMSRARTQASNSASPTWPSLSAASRRLVPSRCAVCAILALFS